jgi:hypothetical protein
MKYSVIACLTLSLLSAAAETPKSVEIRFCPASAVRSYPLESGAQHSKSLVAKRCRDQSRERAVQD